MKEMIKKRSSRGLFISGVLLIAFAVWTVLVRTFDVRAIGPENTSVGFAALNGYVHALTGENMRLYVITDWLGLVPIGVALVFAILGSAQWIRRKSISKVDYSILVLGGFYVAVAAVYVLFELVHVNYRPMLINGALEVSYPSSTTMLVLCVMPTAIMQACSRIKKNAFKWTFSLIMGAFAIFMVVARVISGVHWISDIIGGTLISAALVIAYYSFVSLKE